MFKVVLFSALVGCALASPLNTIGRVVNGTDAEEGEIPYIVSLKIPNAHSCGGSIITPTAIFSAAHCLESLRPQYLKIQYGVLEITSDENIASTKAIYLHEDYSPWPWDYYPNDVGVALLETPLTWSATVQPIALPEQGETPPFGEWAVLAGWGHPYSGGSVMTHLQRVDILVYSDEDCSAAHGSKVDARYHLCAGVPEGGKGQCSGDSGGPLAWGGKQWGSVSWSVKPCAIKGYPGVYGRTPSYVDWINSKVGVGNKS